MVVRPRVVVRAGVIRNDPGEVARPGLIGRTRMVGRARLRRRHGRKRERGYAQGSDQLALRAHVLPPRISEAGIDGGSPLRDRASANWTNVGRGGGLVS
jgi:hypothetical protein